MTYRNIILIGITGVGKTTIGRFLADNLKRTFIDLDKVIELRCGVDIPTIFEIEGEEGFRDRETEALREVISNNRHYVLSLGGGCVVRTENRELIANNSDLIVQLTADINIIVERLSKSSNKRPLLQNSDIKQKINELYLSRKHIYDSICNINIDTANLKPHQVIAKLSAIYKNHKSN